VPPEEPPNDAASRHFDGGKHAILNRLFEEIREHAHVFIAYRSCIVLLVFANGLFAMSEMA
jgi:hypothetical protein